MKQIILLLFLLLTFIGVSYYIIYQVESHNMNYYWGKDNGMFAQFESIIVMSVLFYTIMTKRNRIISALVGFGFGMVSGITGYLLYFFTYDLINDGIIFPIYSLIIFIGLFFLREKILKTDKTTNANTAKNNA